MSDRGVVRGTRRRRSIPESGHPILNSMVLDSDLVFDEHDLVNTCNNVIQRSPAISDCPAVNLHLGLIPTVPRYR